MSKVISILIVMCISSFSSWCQTIDTKVSLVDAVKKIPGPKGQRYFQAMEKGDMTVGLYAPHGKDEQKPHDQDEVYVVMSGRSKFFDGTQTYAVEVGDVLYVPARVVHRFEEFTDDFKTWVVFYGPKK